MNPNGLMSCMSIRKAPLDKKQEDMNEFFDSVRELQHRFDMVDRYNVSDEIKEAIKESLKQELQEIKNEMYSLIESIEFEGR
jgi:hypothetical protein